MSRQSYIFRSFIYYALGFVVVGTIADWQDEYTAILNDESNKDFLNSLNKLKSDFEAYNFDADRAIPWNELKLSMETVDRMRVHYEGAAVASDLNEVHQTTANLMNQYRDTTTKMFRWAVMARETLHLLNLRKDKLKNMARIKHFAQNLLNDGKSNIQRTVNELNELSKSLIGLEYKLKRIAATVRSESASGCSRCWRRQAHNNLINALDSGIDQIGTIRSRLIEKVTATRSAIEREVKYVETLHGKAIELSGRSLVMPVDLFDLIFEDLDAFATNLNVYVTRHGGGAVYMTVDSHNRFLMAALSTISAEDQSDEVYRNLQRQTLEMEFLVMTNNVDDYVDRMERTKRIEIR